MITVGQFANHFLTLEPHKNLNRLTFFNFLKYCLPQEAEFKVDFIDVFYDRVLGHQYWQANKGALGEQIKKDLQVLNSRVNIPIDFSACVHACDLQLVNLEQPQDFASLLAKQVKKMESAGEKVKSFRLPKEGSSQQDILFVRLLKDFSLIVEIRQNLAVIVDGELQLTRPHTRLIYDNELEFDYNVEQQLQLSPMRLACFRAVSVGATKQKVKGVFVQLPHLQCTEAFDRELDDIPELLHAIKRIERYFVNPITDPYFQHIMDAIHVGQNEKQI